MILGIDLSLNSTGICVYDPVTKAYRFGASVNMCSLSSKKVTPTLPELLKEGRYSYLNDLNELGGITLCPHERSTVKPDNHVDIGQRRLKDAATLPGEITAAIHKTLGERVNDVTSVAIEDYSMASITDNLIQICEVTSVLKNTYLLPLIQKDYTKFFAIPGPKMKMLAGNGNFNKFAMLMAFIDLKDDDVVHSMFHIWCIKNLQQIVHKAEVLTPVSDIIDAFWAVKYTREIILTGKVVAKKKKVKTKPKKP